MLTYNLSRSGLLPAIAILLIFSSCKKDIHDLPSGIHVDNPSNKASILPFPLDWEGVNNDQMPSPTLLLAPWSSGSNQEFIPDIARDYKHADGWELVYNTFSPTGTTSPAFFVLYNKWRGLVRFYLYLPPSNPGSSTYLNDGLSLAGTGISPMLNYIGAAVVDYNTNVRTTTQIEKYRLQQTGSWQAAQYEIAYDPNIQTLTFDDLKMIWTMTAIDITEQNMSGTISATITGTITQAGASQPDLTGLVSSVMKSTFTAAGQSIFTTSPNINGIGQKIFDAAKSSANDGLSGIVKGLLNGIFGGASSPTVQQVNLALAGTIALKGTLTTVSGLGNPSLVIPGQKDNQTAPGYVPGYPSRMGVFYISAKPKVNVQDQYGSVIGGYQGYKQYVDRHTYTIDNNSYSVLFNPDVINSSSTGAHIENLKKELIYFGPNIGPIGTWIYADGTTETVGSIDVQTNLTYSEKPQWVGAGLPPHVEHDKVAIRISFNVVPNTNPGNIRPLIVKTFFADQVYP